MSELKQKLIEKYDGQPVGGDVLCPHPVTGKMMTAARGDREGGHTITPEWKRAKKEAKENEAHQADVDKLADEQLAKEVELRVNEKAAEAVAASEPEVADVVEPEPEENTTQPDET